MISAHMGQDSHKIARATLKHLGIHCVWPGMEERPGVCTHVSTLGQL